MTGDYKNPYPMRRSDDALAERKRVILETMAAGAKTQRRAARLLGMSERTIYDMRKADPEFDQQFRDAQEAYDDDKADELEEILWGIAKDPERNSQFQAARYLMDRYGARDGWGSARKALELYGAAMLQGQMSSQGTLTPRPFSIEELPVAEPPAIEAEVRERDDDVDA